MTTKGDVSSIEYAQQRSETREVAELTYPWSQLVPKHCWGSLTNTIARMRLVGGNSNVSMPVK